MREKEVDAMLGEWLQAIILGIVEGLTEFLPISSTGHMIVTAYLLSFEGEKAKTFEVVVQLGAVLAVLILYIDTFKRMLVEWMPFRRQKVASTGRITLIHVGLAMAPAVIVGLVLHDWIKTYLFQPSTVMIGLVLGGLLMIVAEKKQGTIHAHELDQITHRQALGIGLFQCLALWPGFSRSGSTISGGMLLGTSQKAAAEFTFIVSVPIMLAATSLDVWKSREFLTLHDLPLFLIGLSVSFMVAMLAVVTFLKWIKRLKLSWFAYYRFVLAGCIAWLIYF
ncbi:undecaprenyl-diphosphate phosphatase [Marinicrinis sediminis]|uniref:Undecaprenyl-diphosphatase n=1 Tax=Marinicrinis sediminis TaxID=1652465 RepID=A0ABW5RE06_9BACL